MNLSDSSHSGGKRVVLAISQNPQALAGQDGPETDFGRLASLTGGDVVGNDPVPAKSRLLAAFERASALDLRQAFFVLKHYPDADVYVSFSERVGIPLGLLLARRKQRPAHIVIAHRLSTLPKMLASRLGRWQRGVDRLVTFCAMQHFCAESLVGKRAAYVKAGVTDSDYYTPGDTEEDYVLSVGSESRDYSTLVAAASRAGVRLKILAASPWCRRQKTIGAAPANVEFLAPVGYPVLRELYRKALAVAVPLYDVDYAAGHNAICEAFCVNKPLIVSASRGIIDYVTHLVNSCVVPVRDIDAMTAALTSVCTNISIREMLKEGAESAVREYACLNVYANRMLPLILGVDKENA